MEKGWQRNRLRKVFGNRDDVDAIVIINTNRADPTFYYLTGFIGDPGDFEDSIIVATRKRIFLIISPVEYQNSLDKKTEIMEVIDNRYSDEVTTRWLNKLIRGKRIGINAPFLPVRIYDNLKKAYSPKRIVDVSRELLEARLIKDKDEIRKIRKAVGITRTAMQRIRAYFKAGMTEQQLAARFNFIQMSLGAVEPSFRTIVCFGKNAALPHHSPDGTKLRKGDLILIDAGARVDNYCSDFDRTFFFRKASREQEEMVDVVKEAQRRAIAAMREGEKGSTIYDIANNYINNANNGRYRGRFIHKLGHSIGLEVHDGGIEENVFRLYKQENILKEGMVLSVEPGIYIPGFGGARVEDDILVTKKGHIIL